jgi:hypothetical protein
VIELVIVRAERGRYSAVLGERVLCTVKEPFFAAARILLAEGVDPETVLTMRHQGSQTRSLTMTVGKAAKLDVVDDGRGVPRFVSWRDVRDIAWWKGGQAPEERPPVSQNEVAGTGHRAEDKTSQ